MFKESWKDDIKEEDIPKGDLRICSDILGFEKTVEIMLLLPGLTIQIPKKPFKEVKERYILKHYDGSRYCIDKLAIACDLSQRQVYNIIRKKILNADKY